MFENRLSHVLAIVLTSLLSSKCECVEQFFPAGVLSADGSMDRSKADWYSQELAALHEPSLWQDLHQNPGADVYRFLWLRSFHAPICVRLTLKSNSGGTLVAKEGSVHGATEHGKLVQVRTKTLSAAQVKVFLDRLHSVHFWEIRSSDNDFGADGSQWIIEGKANGRYKAVDVWSAPPENPAHILGAMLAFDLAQIQVPASLIY